MRMLWHRQPLNQTCRARDVKEYAAKIVKVVPGFTNAKFTLYLLLDGVPTYNLAVSQCSYPQVRLGRIVVRD